MLALLDSNPELVMTLESAALLHQLPVMTGSESAHLLVSPSSSHRKTTVTLASGGPRFLVAQRHCIDVPESDIVTVSGIRTLSVERLAIDFARFRPACDSLPLVDAAMQRFTGASKFHSDRAATARTQAIDGLVRRLAEIPGTQGTRRARDVITHASPLSESPYESRLRWVVLALGLPNPELQKHVHVDGKDYYVDLWIEELRAALEFDGLAKYDIDTREGRNAFIDEKRRDDHLLSRGVLAHHFMHDDVKSIEAGRRAISRALGSRVLHGRTPRRYFL